MSADCLFILKGDIAQEECRQFIGEFAYLRGFGIWDTPSNSLLVFNQIPMDENSMMFEPTDSTDTNSSELLLCPENCAVNGIYPSLPLCERLSFIQSLAEQCLRFAESVEIYISDDNPWLPDYSRYEIPCDMIAQVLHTEYKKSMSDCIWMPCVYIRILDQRDKGSGFA